jgi:hypothetical protein
MRELVVIQNFSTSKRFDSGQRDHTVAEAAAGAFRPPAGSGRGSGSARG